MDLIVKSIVLYAIFTFIFWIVYQIIMGYIKYFIEKFLWRTSRKNPSYAAAWRVLLTPPNQLS
jgi:hypothetical protein